MIRSKYRNEVIGICLLGAGEQHTRLHDFPLSMQPFSERYRACAPFLSILPHCLMDQALQSVRLIRLLHLVNVFRVPDRSLGPQIPPFCPTEPVQLSFHRSSLTVRVSASGLLPPVLSLWCLLSQLPCLPPHVSNNCWIYPAPNPPAENTPRHDYGS